jgi:hypothetical protein
MMAEERGQNYQGLMCCVGKYKGASVHSSAGKSSVVDPHHLDADPDSDTLMRIRILASK